MANSQTQLWQLSLMRQEAALLELQKINAQKWLLENQIREIETLKRQQTQICLPADKGVLKKWVTLKTKDVEKLQEQLKEIDVVLKHKQAVFSKHLGATTYFEQLITKQKISEAQLAEDVAAENIRSLWQFKHV